MSDQRHATDYRPSCDVHGLIIKQNNIKNSEQMRMFLQRNADKLRELNVNSFQERAGCNSCKFYHVDPNGNGQHWSNYKKWLEFDQM